MTQVNCKIEIPKTAAESAPSLTVGREFLLHCEGEWPELKTDQVEFRLDEADQFKIKLLQFQFVSRSQADLLVTSYRPGQHQLKMLQLVDSEHSVVLGDVQFTVNSVINPQAPPTEPYGPVGPLSLTLPIWYAFSVMTVVLILIFYGFWKWRLRAQKRKLLGEMRLHEYVQDPAQQFYQAVRKIQRGFGFFSGMELKPGEAEIFVKEVNQAFKIYLARHFQIPTLKWSRRRILIDLKKNHREFYQLFGKDLQKNLTELSRALNNASQLSVKDCQQLMDLLRTQIDLMDRHLKAKIRGENQSRWGEKR